MPEWLDKLYEGIKEVAQPFIDMANIVTYAPNLYETIKGMPEVIRQDSFKPLEGKIKNPTLTQRALEIKRWMEEEFPKDPEELQAKLAAGWMPPLMPGVIKPNFRAPEAIQALRKTMAAEQRARGPLAVTGQTTSYLRSPEEYAAKLQEFGLVPGQYPVLEELYKTGYRDVTDPTDLLLRGPWYHGLREEARKAIPSRPAIEELLPWDKFHRTSEPTNRQFAEWARPLYERLQRYRYGNIPGREIRLADANFAGFPLSLHDIASISNKLGEPAGVSLSLLPSKSGQSFSPDQMIHRVMPLYGGPPTERVVNLMTPEGRGLLNDAYDVVANRFFNPEEFARNFNTLAQWQKQGIPLSHSNPFTAQLDTNFLLKNPGTGPFNLALSEQLQQMGKRGILYNPLRWNEYEMLMLDPKWALPLDYRKYSEYIPKSYKGARANKAFLQGFPEVTPGAQRGLQELMPSARQAEGYSRLGSIYQERPWSQRLNEENRRRLMEMLDPSIKDSVYNQLWGGGSVPEVGGISIKTPKKTTKISLDSPLGKLFGEYKSHGDPTPIMEHLMDIPSAQLGPAFQKFEINDPFPAGWSKADSLWEHLSDLDMDNQLENFVKHLLKQGY